MYHTRYSEGWWVKNVEGRTMNGGWKGSEVRMWNDRVGGGVGSLRSATFYGFLQLDDNTLLCTEYSSDALARTTPERRRRIERIIGWDSSIRSFAHSQALRAGMELGAPLKGSLP